MVHKVIDAVNRAREIGTYGALDRSQQYEYPKPAELLRSVNQAWTNIRKLQAANDLKDAEILQLKHKLARFRMANIALTSVVTGLAWEGLKALFVLVK